MSSDNDNGKFSASVEHEKQISELEKKIVAAVEEKENYERENKQLRDEIQTLRQEIAAVRLKEQQNTEGPCSASSINDCTTLFKREINEENSLAGAREELHDLQNALNASNVNNEQLSSKCLYYKAINAFCFLFLKQYINEEGNIFVTRAQKFLADITLAEDSKRIIAGVLSSSDSMKMILTATSVLLNSLKTKLPNAPGCTPDKLRLYEERLRWIAAAHVSKKEAMLNVITSVENLLSNALNTETVVADAAPQCIPLKWVEILDEWLSFVQAHFNFIFECVGMLIVPSDFSQLREDFSPIMSTRIATIQDDCSNFIYVTGSTCTEFITSSRGVLSLFAHLCAEGEILKEEIDSFTQETIQSYKKLFALEAFVLQGVASSTPVSRLAYFLQDALTCLSSLVKDHQIRDSLAQLGKHLGCLLESDSIGGFFPHKLQETRNGTLPIYGENEIDMIASMNTKDTMCNVNVSQLNVEDLLNMLSAADRAAVGFNAHLNHVLVELAVSEDRVKYLEKELFSMKAALNKQ